MKEGQPMTPRQPHPPAATRNRLGIYRTRNCWMISYLLSPQRAEIARLFKTTELPLPFIPSADEQTVRATLAAQQPDAEIYRVQDQR